MRDKLHPIQLNVCDFASIINYYMILYNAQSNFPISIFARCQSIDYSAIYSDASEAVRIVFGFSYCWGRW